MVKQRKGPPQATEEQIEALCHAFMHAANDQSAGRLFGWCGEYGCKGKGILGIRFALSQGHLNGEIPAAADQNMISLTALTEAGISLAQLRQPLKERGLGKLLTILGRATYSQQKLALRRD